MEGKVFHILQPNMCIKGNNVRVIGSMPPNQKTNSKSIGKQKKNLLKMQNFFLSIIQKVGKINWNLVFQKKKNGPGLKLSDGSEVCNTY